MANWENLTKLYLCISKNIKENNRIGDRGCQFLTQMNSYQMQEIRLGN